MSNKTTFEVTGVARLDVSQVKQAAEQIKSSLQGVTLPGGIDKNLASIFQRLNDEIAEFEVNSKKATTNADWSNVIKSGEKILGLYSKMEGQIRQLGDISESEMKTLFPPEVTDRIRKAEQAIKNYTKATSENAAAVKKQQGEVDKLAKKQSKAKANRDAEQGKTQVSNGEYAAMISQQKALGKAAAEAAAQVDKLQAEYDEMTAARAGKRGRKPQELLDTQQRLEQAKTAYAQATQAAQAFDQKMQSTTSPKILAELDKELNEATISLDAAKQKLVELGQNDTASLNQLFTALSQIDGIDISNVTHDLEGAKQAVENLTVDQVKQLAENLAKVQSTVDGAAPAMERFRGSIDNTKTSIQDLNSMQSQVESLKNSFLHFFSLTNGWMLLRRGIRAAYEAVKELDDAMTEIAVVSEYTLDDIWAMRDGYTKAASDMGAKTIDLVNATKLYVQQGMDLNEAQEVGIETTKMARIANLDGAEATNLMTAALRGFNMEMNEANRVNDVYSQLAAKSAADTEEIATAMSKTASIAANAGASFENTSAFLTQIIETTREAPETAGTALKTIIARFQELKKAPSEIGEVDGEMIDANKIETALQTAGVELRNAQGEFRNFDDVIIELAGKWDSLDVMTQRYIATMAAGSRQQSRFIALMADSERLMELTGYAANSAGASNEQFNKTLDSLESKINKLKNAWSLYLQNLANNEIIKGVIDLLTGLLNIINSVTASMPGFTGSIFQAILTFAAFKAAGTLISKAFATFGPMLFKSGTKAGAEVASGMNYGLARGLTTVKTTWKKFTTWLSKTKVNIFNNKKTVAQAKNEIKAIGNVERAKRAYDAEVKKSGANSQNAVTAQKALNQAQKDMTSTMQLNADQMQAYNTLTKSGIAADTAALAAKNGLTKADIDETIASMRAAGATDAEINAKIREMATNNAAAGSEIMLNNAKKVTIAARFKALAAILFGNKQKAIDIMLTAGLITAEQADALAKSTQTGAQWALNAATYAFPGMWLLLIIVAIIAAVALLVVGIMALADALNETDAERLERLNKNAEEAAEAADRAAEAYDNLKSGVSDFKEGIDNIAAMTKGTQDFRDAIMESNLKALELLETYDALATGIQVDSDGLITFSEESIQNALNNAAMQKIMTSSGAAFANIAVKEEQQRQSQKRRMDSGDFTIQKQVTTVTESKAPNSREANTSPPKSTTTVNVHRNPSEISNYQAQVTYNGKTTSTTVSTITMAEEEIREVAQTFRALGDDEEARAVELNKLTEKYGLSGDSLEDLIIDAKEYDLQLQQDEQALQALNEAAIAAAISLNGLVAPENREVVTETLALGLTEDVYDWGVSGGANDATYMGDTAINSSGDEPSQGMTNFVSDMDTVMARSGQSVNWTNENSEGQILIDMAKAMDPDKEINYAADDKEVDDEGEGLGDEFKNTARTVFTQMNAIVLDDTMKNNADLEKMLSDDIGVDTLDPKTLRDMLNSTEVNADRGGAFTNSVMAGIYKREDDQIDQQNQLYARMGKFFAGTDGKAVYSDLSLSDEAQKVKTTLTAMEEAFALGAEDLDTKIDKYGTAVDVYNALQAEQAKNLVGEEGVFKDVEQMNAFASIVDKMSNDLGQATAAAFSSLGSNDDQDAFIEYLANVGDSAIATATAIREMADSNNSALQDAALIMGTFGEKAISVKDQVTELYDIIGSEALAEMAADGGLSASKMMELAKTSSETQQVLDNTGISAHTLAEYYTLLSEGTISAISTSETFIKVLDELNAATSTIEDSFGFIDTFEASRSQTEIGSYFGEMRASMQELLDMGAYGDQQLFDYASVIVGEEKLQEMVNTYGDLEIAIKEAMESADFGENFYSMWTKLDATGSDMISVGENGAIDFDLANIDSVDALRQEIMTKLNVSDIVADAMIADAQTFSGDLKKGLDKLSLGDALAEWLSSVKTVGGKKVLNEKELNAIAKKTGLDPKEIKEKLQENLDEEDVELVIDPIIKDGKLTDETSSAVFEAFEASDWDVNATYQMLIDLGLDPKDAEKQMEGFIDQAAGETSNFPFQFNGEVFEGTVGQLKTSVSTAIADGTIDPVVQAAQKLTAAQQAAQLSSGVAQGVAAGLGGAIQAFVGLAPEWLREFLRIDKAAANFTASMIDKAKTAAATSGDADVKAAAEAYENALNTAKKLQEEKEKEDAKNKAAAEKTEEDLLGDDNNASGYGNPNSQLNPGEGFGDKEDKEDDDTWEEDYDWLYNLEKKIAKQVRERNKLESEYNRMLTLGNATQGELLEKIREQVAAENSHMDLLNKEKSKREQELKALKNEFSDVSAYVKWDAATGAPKIDHEAMKGVSDPKLGERIDKAVEEFERIQGELEQIEDDTNDIKDAQAERLREQLDQYVSLEERLYDAIVSEREKEIEGLETINDTISDAASEMLDKIQTGIDDYRQAREDEEALSDIEDMESRLALMRSDTSGANQLDILALEDELEQARQDFTDNKIDQAIDQLSRQNELAQQQRERQIELMQWQLEQDQENGMIADQVNKLLTYFSASGDSTTIEDMLKNSENWTGLATQQKNDWVNELNDTIAKAGEGWRNANAASNTVASGSSITFTDKNGKTVKGTMQSDGSVKDKSGNTYSGVFLGADGKYHQYADGKITAKPKDKPTTSTTTTTTSSSKGIKITDSVKKYVSDSIWGGYWGNNPERKKRLTEVFGAKAAAEIQGLVNQEVRFYPKGSRREWSYENQKKKKYNRYETGGLADFTGPAWLDGTKARPEYVLNAEQTKGFLALVDMLGDFDDSPTAGGNNYYDVRIEVDELSNDYDVEQLMDKMKRVITDDAMYRNVNAIDLGRR